MSATETIEKQTKIQGFITHMKTKWQLNSAFQVVMVILTFTLTGSTVVYLRKWLFTWLNYATETPLWLKTVTYLFFIFPSYQILILVYGTLLGQFRFFWEKEKKLFSFFVSRLFKK